jgi:hypothetical protein
MIAWFLLLRPSRHPPSMHVALSVKDVVVMIVDHFKAKSDAPTLLALATTNRVFSDAALDVIWEKVESFTLAQQMSTSLWTIRIDRTGDGENHELVRLQ